MKTIAKLKHGLLSALLAFSIAGCATIDPEFRDPRDPLESFNRAMYDFNDGVDRALLKPLAEGYVAVVPPAVNKGITNFFNNLSDIRSAANNLLQLKIKRSISDLGRFAVNSTLGVLGFMDVASNMDMPRYDEDFGQTLGVWGFEPGPFIVLPLLGPSSARDTVGTVVDWYADPLTYVQNDAWRWSLKGLRLVDTRADLLNASRVLDEAALDPYAFVRDAYLQKRRSEVYDGNPPE